MKKLKKLEINSEKLMKNDELLKLSGGGGACTCCCYDPIYHCAYGYLLSPECSCVWDCSITFSGSTGVAGNCYPMSACWGY